MTMILSQLIVENEADVEQKIIYPLLTEPEYLGIDAEAIRPKDYLPPTELDKSSGKTKGYFPDFSVWFTGLPLLIVEAKDPAVDAKVGFREACLYARHINSRYQSGLNPCQYVMACNGVKLLVGLWDQEHPILEISVAELEIGSTTHLKLIEFCNQRELTSFANECRNQIKIHKGVKPYNKAGGQSLIYSKLALNTFASELSPILRRYFLSTSADEINREIAEKAYVSSSETTEYDRILEAMLKDRASTYKDTIIKKIETSKSSEPTLTKALHDFNSQDINYGQLQIIQGGVGSGKSLFARRYHDLLEPEELKSINCWAFIDFNGSPVSLQSAESWLCEAFISSFIRENSQIDLYDHDTLKGIFSKNVLHKKASYEILRKISDAEELRERAKDLSEWQNDKKHFTEGIAHYLHSTNRKLIVVMDNVDKLELQNQLDAFQISLWFMQLTKAFVILQMRDETYERYKNQKPLDTYRAGIVFHIAPPRFIDVVKRRLELGIEYLANNSSEWQEFILDNGVRTRLPRNEVGNFLKALYQLLFGSRRTTARLLEALAGKDVRKALDMFVSIVTSGHLSTSTIMSNVRGHGSFKLSEHTIIKILMRTEYRFFNSANGNVINILHYDNEWINPDNFLLPEVLYFLCMKRKQKGELGLEGYFSVSRICNELQKLGYDKKDVHSAINHLLVKNLIVADNFNTQKVDLDDCVKIQASGFMHLRVLFQRMEYLIGIYPTIPISDQKTCDKLASIVNSESQRGFLNREEKTEVITLIKDFLNYELNRLRERNPFYEPQNSVAIYLINSLDEILLHYNKVAENPFEQNELDLL